MMSTPFTIATGGRTRSAERGSPRTACYRNDSITSSRTFFGGRTTDSGSVASGSSIPDRSGCSVRCFIRISPWLEIVQDRHKFTVKNTTTGVEIEYHQAAEFDDVASLYPELGIVLTDEIKNRYPFQPGSGEFNSVPGKTGRRGK